MENDCVTGRVLSLHRILKQTVPRVLSFIVHGLSSAHPNVMIVTLGLACTTRIRKGGWIS
jgi:hypothetical protein